MNRVEYFAKRLLLIGPTFLGITFVVFMLCQVVPGGPVEQAMIQMRGLNNPGGAAQPSSISEAQREALRERFGFHLPLHQRYWNWLVRDRMGLTMKSYKYSDQTAWQVISSRFHISLIFGLTGFLLSYLVCIPLGIAKALRDGAPFDVASSVIVFIGFAVPAFALGMVLKMLFCGTVDQFWDFFPVSGFRSPNHEALSTWEAFVDIVHHMFLPVLCYVIGNFAVLTVLMKNSLLEQVSSDYVRTVLAKGGSSTRAIWGHALRNALIPIATGVGGILTVMFAGSVLIESVFEIPGMGTLSIDAITSRDYAVFMCILSITSVLGLLGNVVQDFAYVIIDPRINFSGDR